VSDFALGGIFSICCVIFGGTVRDVFFQLAFAGYVGAFFNYLLRDDADLRGWQSGVLWRDGTPKRSFPSFQRAIAEVGADEVDCSALKGGALPQP